MKLKLFITGLFLVLTLPNGITQNTMGKANDKERIAIAVVFPENSNVPANSANILSARIKRALTLNGLSSENQGSIFYIKPEVNTLTKNVTATAPPMISMEVEVSLVLTDQFEGNSFEQVLYNFKGVGQTEEAAYNEALKRLNPRDGKLRAFIRNGKDKIIEYYNSKCDLILSKANGYVSASKYQKAYNLLMGVPPVCRECYDKAMLKIEEFGDQVPETVPEEATVSEEEPNNNLSGKKIELINGLVLQYKEGRYYGEKLVLKFDIINNTGEEQSIELRGGKSDNYIVNQNGEEIGMEQVQIGNKKHHWGLNYDILPNTPVEAKLLFPKEQAVRQIVLDLNRNTHKIDHLPLQ